MLHRLVRKQMSVTLRIHVLYQLRPNIHSSFLSTAPRAPVRRIPRVFVRGTAFAPVSIT